MRRRAAVVVAGAAAIAGVLRSATRAGADSGCAGQLEGPVSDHGTAAATGATVSLTAGDFYFEPTCVAGLRTGEVTLRIVNAGRLLHNISVPDQGLDQDIAPRESVTITLAMAGHPLRFICKYHLGAGMVGALLPR